MALDFPNSPTVGQTFAGPGGIIWTWDNVKWVGGGGGGGGGGSSSVVVSPTPPASPTVGQLWWDSTGGQLYIRYEDPNTQQWVTTHNIGFGVPLNVTNGGTGIVTYSQGDLIYGSAPDTLARLTKSTATTRYLANTGASNNPAWDQINLTNGVTGILPIANGGTGATTIAASPFLPLVGGTLTGGLTVRHPSSYSVIDISKVASGQGCVLQGSLGAAQRWLVQVGDGAAETGSNTGSNFGINRCNDAGVLIDTPLSINRASGATSLVLALGVVAPAGSGAQIDIKKAGSGYTSVLYGTVPNQIRWAMHLGDSSAESGGGLGSNFVLQAYNDAGALIGTALSISRQTQVMTLSQDLWFAGNKSIAWTIQNYINFTGADFNWGVGANGVMWILRNSDRLAYNPTGTVGGMGAYANLASFASMKSNMRPIADPITLIKGLKPVAYTFNSTGEEQHGFVIEDLVNDYPETVKYDPDSKPMGYDQAMITAGLTAALQELIARVEALEGAP